jgi:hypothetical protein
MISHAAHLAVLVRRSSARRRRRFGLCAALAGLAVVLGGLGAVLLVFFALMLVLDAVLPMPGATWSEADDHFWRLVRERRREDRLRRLRRLAPERLDVLDEDGGWASTAERRPVGVQPIAIESVIGTVEESRAAMFDRSFRPHRSESERWRGLWMAEARGAALPPIAVYRVGASHFVRDGHHRVSVARDRGSSTIDAEVVELR